MGLNNYKVFTDYIKDQDDPPISLNTTKQVLEKRQFIEELSLNARQNSKLLVQKQTQIADSIKKALIHADVIDQTKNFVVKEIRDGYEKIYTEMDTT